MHNFKSFLEYIVDRSHDLAHELSLQPEFDNAPPLEQLVHFFELFLAVKAENFTPKQHKVLALVIPVNVFFELSARLVSLILFIASVGERGSRRSKFNRRRPQNRRLDSLS